MLTYYLREYYGNFVEIDMIMIKIEGSRSMGSTDGKIWSHIRKNG